MLLCGVSLTLFFDPCGASQIPTAKFVTFQACGINDHTRHASALSCGHDAHAIAPLAVMADRVGWMESRNSAR